MSSNFSVIILAAGQGVRMRSSSPKVLHSIAGMPILERIIKTAEQLNPLNIIVVYGHGGDELKKALSHYPKLIWAPQEKQLGTGHAALQGLPYVGDVDRVLILYGDIPLIRVETLKRLLGASQEKSGISFITICLDNPFGFGRVLRNASGKVLDIIEEKDANAEEKKIQEVSMGFFVVPKTYLSRWLPILGQENAQNEHYLSDIIKLAAKENVFVTTISPDVEYEVLGVNDKIQFATLERYYQQEKARELMINGVTLLDPARVDIRGDVTVGQDVVIDVNVILEGTLDIGNQVSIGPNVFLKNVVIHDGAKILANSYIENAVIGANAVVGPFARVRPGTELGAEVRVGNFVEIKNSIVAEKTKINHLSYIGDASIGKEVNIGAGTITCNFDGVNKYRTTIGNHVFVGSDTQLVAPISIGDGVTIGAGTTVVKDVPSNHLIHHHVQYRIVANWAPPKKIEQ